jgi:hypothetical protein
MTFEFPRWTDVVGTVAAPLLLLVIFLYVRRGRRISEELADLFALTLGQGEGLRTALAVSPDGRRNGMGFHFHSATTNSDFSIHPSRESRLKQIKHYETQPAGFPAQVPTVKPKPSGSASYYCAADDIRNGILVLFISLVVWNCANTAAENAYQGTSMIPGWLFAVVLSITGIVFFFGLKRLLSGLLQERPVPWTRKGGLLIVGGLLVFILEMLYVPYIRKYMNLDYPGETIYTLINYTEMGLVSSGVLIILFAIAVKGDP